MSVCENVSPKKRRICIGDLNTPIKIQVRTLTPENINNVDYNENFTEVKEVWSAIETKRGFSSFNDIGTTATGKIINFTHQFYIRYSPSFVITSENWLEYKNEKYVINSVENLEEKNNFLKIYALKKGTKTKPANLV